MPQLGDTDAWVDMVRPAVQAASAGLSGDDAIRAAERAAVLWSTRNLLMHRVVAARVEAGLTRVYAARYDIASGRVEFWDAASRLFREAGTEISAIATKACVGCACGEDVPARRRFAALPAI